MTTVLELSKLAESVRAYEQARVEVTNAYQKWGHGYRHSAALDALHERAQELHTIERSMGRLPGSTRENLG